MTDPLTGLRAEMAAYLRESPLFEGIAVREEFPGGYKGVPTRQACVTVGISGVERAAAPGGRVKLTLRFDILCPPGGNPGCHSLFDRLCGALFFQKNAFGAVEIHCGDAAFDRETGCLVLTAEAVLAGLLLPNEDAEGEGFTDIIIKATEV